MNIQSLGIKIENFWKASTPWLRRNAGGIVAIDLGTANIRVYFPGKGIVVNEASLIALRMDSRQVVAIGDAAKVLARRQPRDIVVIHPIRDGVVADCEAAGQMMAAFLTRAQLLSDWSHPSMLICTPADITPLEQKAYEDAARRAGARTVALVEEPYAVTAASLVSSSPLRTMMVADIGAGTTDVTVTSDGRVLHASTRRVGGSEIDRTILRYLHHERMLEVSESTAEEIKIELGTVLPPGEPRTMRIRGRNLRTGLPEEITVTDHEVYPLIQPAVRVIRQHMLAALEDISTGASVELLDSGITLSGGLSQLHGLAEMLSRELNLSVHTVPNPMLAAILGAGRFLEEQSESKFVEVLNQRESPGW